MITSKRKNKDLQLYIKAREAYYNGEEIMPDIEFDALEKKLGMQNQLIGAPASSSNNYTITHPFIMGSLNKIQVHESSDWSNLYKELPGSIRKNPCIVTPKFDGCSFEMVVVNGKLFSVSTRGDGNWGKNIYRLMRTMLKKQPLDFELLKKHSCYVLRGEILISKETFMEKYSKEFKNPRSFVSGMVNSDYDAFNRKEFLKASDLEYVIYDYRFVNDGVVTDLDRSDTLIAKLLENQGIYTTIVHSFSPDTFKKVYEALDKYRSECKFPLDGFVIKPCSDYRENIPSEYPKDCVAVKFKPMVAETTVTNITWNLGKSGEYFPTLQVDPVVLDGKTIKNVSGHNYGFILDNFIGIGAKIIISLAGDIIPFIYKVTQPGWEVILPSEQIIFKGCHLYANLTKEQDIKNRFMNSCDILQVPGLGPALSEQLYDYLIGKDKYISNILKVNPNTIKKAIPTVNGEKVYKAFIEILDSITLSKVIETLCFESHGPKVCDKLQEILITGKGTPPNYKANWVLDENTKEYKRLTKLLKVLGKGIKDFHLEESNKILCILTGSPKQYKTKKEFLIANPGYKETTSFKEAKVIFTGDINSTSSKMVKAKKLGLDIKEY